MGVFRLLLALSVVLGHGGGFFGFQLAGGGFAVEIFFMVSGFLIQLVLTNRYDPSTELKLFYSNRLLRIFPVYWSSLLISWIISIILYNNSSGYLVQISLYAHLLRLMDVISLIITQVAIVGTDVLMFMNITPTGFGISSQHAYAPAMQLIINPPVWSLSIELAFYALAPLLARRNVAYTVSAMIAFMILRIILIAKIHVLSGLTADHFLPTALPFFLAGMLAFRWRSIVTSGTRIKIVAASTTIICTFVIGITTSIGQNAGIPGQLFGYLFAFISFFGIPSLFSLSQSPKLWDWVKRCDNEFSALSYPVYLLNWQIVFAVEAFLRPTTWRIMIIVAITLGLAAILTRWVEEPIDRFRDRRRLAAKSRAPVMSVSGSS